MGLKHALADKKFYTELDFMALQVVVAVFWPKSITRFSIRKRYTADRDILPLINVTF